MEYKLIAEYMLLSKQERQGHLSLDEECIEIGGDSFGCRALLAHYVGTTIPRGMKILLCHACNNAKCSNVKHLYWGSPSDNHWDKVHAGRWVNPWDYLKKKVGIKEAKRIQSVVGKIGGKTNKDKPSNNRNGKNQYSG